MQCCLEQCFSMKHFPKILLKERNQEYKNFVQWVVGIGSRNVEIFILIWDDFKGFYSYNTILMTYFPCFDKITIFLRFLILALTFKVLIPDKKKKLTEIFILTLLSGASESFMKAFKVFIKPFEAPQRIVKINI